MGAHTIVPISVVSKLSAYSLVSDGPRQAAGGPDDEGAAARHARVRQARGAGHVVPDTWRWTHFILIYSEKTVYKSVIEINHININPTYISLTDCELLMHFIIFVVFK